MHRLVAFGVVVSALVTACADQSTAPAPIRAVSASAAKAPPPPPSPNVTSTLYDTDALGNPLLTRSDDFNGTGFASYAAINKMTSHIGSDGGWQLYIGNQTARTVFLVLSSQGIAAPDGYYSNSVEIYSKCFDQSNVQVSLLSMTAGQANGNCSFGQDFATAATKYKLVMGPMYPGTGTATVTCNAVIGSSCSSWTIVPNMSGANATVANLYHYAHNGSLVFDGVYHNTFSVSAVE
jgi:hypothetical protein